jgi:hypothetical protein
LTAPCELEHCHGAESNRWAKVQAFLFAQLHITASVFPRNLRGCLALWSDFEVNNTLDTEKSDEHIFICDFEMRTANQKHFIFP